MPSHKSEDYKITAVKFHLENDSSFVKTCKIIPPYMLDPVLCKNPDYKTTHNTEYNKHRSNTLYSHVKSKYTQIKIQVHHILPPRDDKRPNACDSPLQPC